ncbi:ketoacyl-synt-domain-containing protein [Violaceomyces palustris]|uniref:Ketoacyl-synt-domain-containing protein n=1 Tax=Violaceomyces palustris TaxID=1673888 RepID=A0ACD0NUF0_9BASI|nr:ketoacyl-synt-domain-containing protein [Violaceomyces palustris]
MTRGQQELEPLAVVGVACRLPGANSPDEFWNLLMSGTDMCGVVPKDLFDVQDYYHSTGSARNRMGATTGNWFETKVKKEFDPRFFGLDREQSLNMDPQQRLSLMVAYEALEDAGWTPPNVNASSTSPAPRANDSSQDDRVGVFVAATCDDYTQNLSSDLTSHVFTGNARQFLAHRLSHFFGFQGPSQTLDTACNASFVALETACTKIRNGSCSSAIVGGVSVITQPQVSVGLDKAHFLSRTGQCKTLDEGADGYSRSDAVSFVVIKRLKDAMKQNDRIYAEILAIGTNHSGEAHSITHPHAPAQAALMSSLLEQSRVERKDVNMIEAHGTGTQAGDLNELTAIHNTFVKDAGREQGEELIFTSSKANIGHSEGASGLGALIKTVLIFKNATVPVHVGIRTNLNPKLEPLLTDGRIVFARDGHLPLRPALEHRAIAVCNNFGAAGGNTSVLLRQHRPSSSTETRLSTNSSDREVAVQLPFLISARSQAALQRMTIDLANFLHGKTSQDPRGGLLHDLSYTLCARRILHPHRKLILASTVDELREKLLGSLDEDSSQKSQTDLRETMKSLASEFQSVRAQVQRYDVIAIGFDLPLFEELTKESSKVSSEKYLRFASSFVLGSLLSKWGGEKPPTVRGGGGGGGFKARLGIDAVERAIERLDRLQDDSVDTNIGISSQASSAGFEAAGLSGTPFTSSLEDEILSKPWEKILAFLFQHCATSFAETFDARTAMKDIAPQARLISIPSYSWEREELYVPYLDRALVTPSWNDDPKFEVVPSAPKAGLEKPLSSLVTKIGEDVFRLEMDQRLGVTASILQAIQDTLGGGSDAKIRVERLELGSGFKLEEPLLFTLTELEGDEAEIGEGLVVDFTSSVQRDLVRASALVRQADLDPRDARGDQEFLQALVPFLSQQRLDIRDASGSSVVPQSIFYLTLSQIQSSSFLSKARMVSRHIISKDCTASLTTIRPGSCGSFRTLMEAVEQVLVWMASKESLGMGGPGIVLQGFLRRSGIEGDLFSNGSKGLELLTITEPFGIGKSTSSQVYVFDPNTAQLLGSVEGLQCVSVSVGGVPSSQKEVGGAVSSLIGSPIPSRASHPSSSSKSTRPISSSSRRLAVDSYDEDSEASSNEDPISSSSSQTDQTEATSISSSGEAERKPSSSKGDAAQLFLDLAASVIAEQTGAPAETVVTSCFADIGIDSLMSLAVLDRLREESELDLPGSLFIDCQDFEELRAFAKNACGAMGGVPESSDDERSEPERAEIAEQAAPEDPSVDDFNDTGGASAVVLCGRKVQGGGGLRPLFLVPDGSGTAAVFRNLPSMGGRLVYGLNSPFLREGAPGWNGGVEEIARYYISQMREKEPEGPYIVGGWSFGGVVSYEMVRQLTRSGIKVEALLLLDSPCPQKMPALPHTIIDWALGSNALAGLGIKKFSPTMTEHFRKAISTLSQYNPPSLGSELGLKVALLTAVQGVGADPKEVVNTNETVEWLFSSRKGLGAHGWDKLCSQESVDVVEFEANHFTMMERSLTPNWANPILDLLKRWGL